MAHTILLYGATGHSGRLIAAEAARRGLSGAGTDCRMILAARDGAALRRIADRHGMTARRFALDDPAAVRRGLDGVDVLLNAAGPFAATCQPLLRGAFEAGCHYADINGELDVYRQLSEFGRRAVARDIALLSGAGATGGASGVLLAHALEQIPRTGGERRLGTVRFAMQGIADFSRGSMASGLRSLREQVAVVRGRTSDDSGAPVAEMVVQHVPVGTLERQFDFRAAPDDPADLRIASAANLVDTLAARGTLIRHDTFALGIETYAQTGPLVRFAHQAAALAAPWLALPGAQAWMQAALGLLPPDPSRAAHPPPPHVMLLQIEDVHGRPLIDWRWQTPDVYTLTARLAVTAACGMARHRHPGWITPDRVIPFHGDHLRDCTLRPRVQHG